MGGEEIGEAVSLALDILLLWLIALSLALLALLRLYVTLGLAISGERLGGKDCRSNQQDKPGFLGGSLTVTFHVHTFSSENACTHLNGFSQAEEKLAGRANCG